MKKSTFLVFILLIATIAHGQNPQNLQERIKEMQATFSRLTMQTEHFSKMNLQAKPQKRHSSFLKSALAVQKLDSIVYQETDTVSDGWHNMWKDEYLYDSEMNNTAWNEKEWNDTTGTWIQTGKVELELDDQGRVEVMNIHYIDSASGELALETRSVAFYSPEGKLDSILHYIPGTENTWIKEGWQVYHYNETGQLVQMDMTVTEEDDEGEYLQGMRFVYTYTAAGKMDTFSWYFLDPDMDLLFSKTQYFYDDSNKLTASEDSTLNFFTFELEKSSRTEIAYNTAGDVSTETYSYWDSDTEAWIAEEKDEYTYGELSFSEVVFPSYLQFWGPVEQSSTSDKAFTEIVTSLYRDGEWEPAYRSLFYYSEGTATNTRDLPEVQVNVFPNPATDNITLTWNNYRQLSLEVYHMTGAKIIQKQVTSGMSVPVSELTDGIYLFKLKNENQTVYSGKLVKK